jgi:hypothetical protein
MALFDFGKFEKQNIAGPLNRMMQKPKDLNHLSFSASCMSMDLLGRATCTIHSSQEGIKCTKAKE